VHKTCQIKPTDWQYASFFKNSSLLRLKRTYLCRELSKKETRSGKRPEYTSTHFEIDRSR